MDAPTQPGEKPIADGDGRSATPLGPVPKGSVRPNNDDEVINDDERERFFWESRYPPEAVRRIRLEAAYVIVIFFAALVGIWLTWRGSAFDILGCSDCNSATLRRYSYMFCSGVLGGSLFGLKYLYKVAARGWWNLDRELWRLFSPWLAGGIAFGVGALANAGLFGFTVSASPSGASVVSLGFIAGYFADSASRKMQEIADTLFGTHARPQKKQSDTAKKNPDQDVNGIKNAE